MKPSLRASLRNFWKSDLPLLERFRKAAENNAIKARKRQRCCGNRGEPGC